MAYVKFLGDSVAHKATVIPDGHILTIQFEKEKVLNLSGFDLFNDKECTVDIGAGAYQNFKTLYRNDEETEKYNGYQLSDNGSVYHPINEDEIPKKPEPTLDEIKANKREEMTVKSRDSIAYGVEFHENRFPYGSEHVPNLRHIYEDSASTGKDGFLKNAKEESVCLSTNQIEELYKKQEKNRAEKEARLNQLLHMIADSTTKEVVRDISYDMELQGTYLENYKTQVQKETDLLEMGILNYVTSRV